MGDATTTAAPARSSSRTRGQALARRARDARRGARRRLAELGTAPRIAGVGLLVFVLTWPVSNPYPQPGLDPSWGIALHQAVHQGLNFGPDIVFTYGPLGFLRKPILAWPWTGRFAFAYTMAVHLALCISLVWAIRRSIPSLLLSALAALVVVGLITQEPILVIAFIWSAALVDPRRTPRQAEWLAGALGVMAGIELLAKFNTGVTVALLALAALLFAPPPRKRPRLLFAGGFALAAAIGWFATGQSLTAIPSFLTGALSIAAGYSEAMGYEDPDPGRIWEFWAAGAFFALGAAAAWVWGPRRARAGLLVLWAILCFTTFKAGFVRHDGGHVNIFFATIAGALCAFAVPARHRMVALLGALLVLLATFASLRADPKIAVHPWNSVKALKSQVAILSDGSTTNEQIAASRGHVAAWYGVDPETFGLIRDHTVHVDPVDAGLAWALRVRWNPAPIFQSYSAYTPDLDRRNADELADPDGPERILRDTKMAIDGRNPAFESPAMMRAMLCHFRSIRNAGRWQVLERVPNRCGPTSEILEVKARFGASVEIPDPPDARSAVVAQIDGLGVAGLESLRTTLYRAKPRYIAFDDTSRWRIVPGTAGDGLVLRVPNGADYPTPFTPGQVPRFLSVSKGDDPEQPDDAVTVRFLSLPIR